MLNPTTIELKKESNTSFKVNLHHYDMKEWWRFPTEEKAREKFEELKKECPTAEVIEPSERDLQSWEK